jgi:hypothetical protein
MIIGCDFHTRYQQIAMMNDATGGRPTLKFVRMFLTSAFDVRVAHPLRHAKGGAFELSFLNPGTDGTIPEQSARQLLCAETSGRNGAHLLISFVSLPLPLTHPHSPLPIFKKTRPPTPLFCDVYANKALTAICG